eukprot:3223119-Amphidinium_carterae.1
MQDQHGALGCCCGCYSAAAAVRHCPETSTDFRGIRRWHQCRLACLCSSHARAQADTHGAWAKMAASGQLVYKPAKLSLQIILHTH